MIKRGLAFLCILLLLTLGCSFQEGSHSVGEAIKQKLTAKKSSEGSKMLAETKAEPQTEVYVFYLEPKNWNLRFTHHFQQPKKLTQQLQGYQKLVEKYSPFPKYSLKVETADKRSFTLPFSADTFHVIDSFDEKTLADVNKVQRELVGVPLLSTTVLKTPLTLTITSPSGKLLLKEKKYYLSPGEKMITPVDNVLPIFRQLCPDLEEIIPGHNRLDENRINLIFVGHGYEMESDNKPTFVRYLPQFLDIDNNGITLSSSSSSTSAGSKKETYSLFPVAGTYHGLFGEEPFKGNANLFNFWYRKSSLTGAYNDGQICQTEQSYTCLFPNTYIINLINLECRSNALYEGNAFVSFSIDSSFTRIQLADAVVTFVHELGHSFGSLADEYVEEGKGDRGNFPNCASSGTDPVTEWGWDREAKIYGGCAYINENYRPTTNSLMRNQRESPFVNFDYVNEHHICYLIASKTGKTVECWGKLITPGEK